MGAGDAMKDVKVRDLFLSNLQTLELGSFLNTVPSVEALLEQIPIAFGTYQLMIFSTL